MQHRKPNSSWRRAVNPRPRSTIDGDRLLIATPTAKPCCSGDGTAGLRVPHRFAVAAYNTGTQAVTNPMEGTTITPISP